MDTVLFYSQGACSLGVFVVLEWVAQPYRICRVERAERPTPRYKRINPLGGVPALRVDGNYLNENAALLASVASRRPELELLAPAGTLLGDQQNAWLSYLGTTFHVAFYPWFATARFTTNEAHHQEIKDAAQKQIRVVFGYVDAALAKSTYLAGEKRSVLDPYLYAMSRWGKRMFDVAAEFPNLARHQQLMEQDAAVQYVLAIENGNADAKSPSGAMIGTVALDDA